MNKKLQAEINNIMDCFTGADGGGRFLDFRMLVQEMDRRASEENDKVAEQALECIPRLSKFIDIASNAANSFPKK